MSKKERRLLEREIQASGEYLVVASGSGHRKVVTLDGGFVYGFPSSPSDHRSVLNTRAALKRLGVLA